MADPSDPWATARAITSARIGLARTGASVATAPLLEFRLAHARARDAVHAELDMPRLVADLAAIGWDGELHIVGSAVANRTEYLLRPDLGRILQPDALSRFAGTAQHDLAIVVADGLSAMAAQTHAAPVLAALAPALHADQWKVLPPVLVRNGRVAIGDVIALLRGARAVLVLIGERPGLSSPDSLSAYITWEPHPGTVDAERNCISNIRPDGLAPRDAASRIAYLLHEMRRRGMSGVALKDESDAVPRVDGSTPILSAE